MSEDRCPYCGTPVILDYTTHEYVCPNCGTVFGYEMLPSYAQMKEYVSIPQVRVDGDVIRRAYEMFNAEVVKELRKIRKDKVEEVYHALESLVKKRDFRVSWDAIRKALEIARKCNLEIDLEELRNREVYENIKLFVATIEGVNIDPEEVMKLAMKYRNLWSGRKPDTIATVFTLIYAKMKGVDLNINVNSRIKKLMKMYEKVISMCEKS